MRLMRMEMPAFGGIMHAIYCKDNLGRQRLALLQVGKSSRDGIGLIT